VGIVMMKVPIMQKEIENVLMKLSSIMKSKKSVEFFSILNFVSSLYVFEA